ncbi:PadR family transcriptional regulator [Phenylobacterium sp.]|uniref:PadR family transcriptional regulator n=1 Tax=Phenylobacterium sp. TaxID=1871053 RepID=UPI0035B4A8BF
MHRHFSKHRERFARHGFGGRMGDEFMGGGRMRGGPGGRRGGRLGRLLEHGDLRFVILALLADKPAHGYELIRALEERTGGAYRPSPGVIYPTLSLLEDEGFVRQTGADGGRKAYEITDEGRKALDGARGAVDAVFARMDEAAAHSSDARPKLHRAMQNLGLALRLRMQRGDVTEEQVDAIAAAIDEAAGKIERI